MSFIDAGTRRDYRLVDNQFIGEPAMPIEVGAFEAKTQLSRLLELARRGERIIITRRGIPVAQLTAVDGRNVQDTQKAIEELKAIRGRSKPGAESIRSLIEEGRRF